MKEYQRLSHTRWDCKYHVVFIPKKRKKKIFEALRRRLGEIFRDLAKQKESQVVEGHLMGDHVHMYLSIPPKYAVSNVVGFIKGKSAIAIARHFGGRARNITGGCHPFLNIAQSWPACSRSPSAADFVF
jgi:putative transposase